MLDVSHECLQNLLELDVEDASIVNSAIHRDCQRVMSGVGVILVDLCFNVHVVESVLMQSAFQPCA